MTSTRAAAGKKAAAGGKLFQDAVAGHLEACRDRGLVAWFAHNQPMYRPAGAGRFIPTKAGGADFYGTLPGGLTFALEAKSYDDERFYRSWLPDGQLEHLNAVHAAGGLALLALQLRRLPGAPAWLIGWGAAPWRALQSAEALHPVDLAGAELQPPFILERFLRRCTRCLRAHLVVGAQRCLWCP